MRLNLSPEKRQANRRNALKSTGPRTELGKRIASVNSKKHGLSVPIEPDQEPQLLSLAELLQSEGIGAHQARDLALKIMEYERNQELELNSMRPKQVSVPPKASDKGGVEVGEHMLDTLTRSHFPEFEDMVSDFFAFRQMVGVKPTKMELREISKMAESATRTAWRIEVRMRRGQILGAQRYMRRATNQLIKALKALDVS